MWIWLLYNLGFLANISSGEYKDLGNTIRCNGIIEAGGLYYFEIFIFFTSHRLFQGGLKVFCEEVYRCCYGSWCFWVLIVCCLIIVIISMVIIRMMRSSCWLAYSTSLWSFRFQDFYAADEMNRREWLIQNFNVLNYGFTIWRRDGVVGISWLSSRPSLLGSKEHSIIFYI